MAKVKVISPADLPCDCMTPPLQCEVGSFDELPACTVNGMTYVVKYSNGVRVVYFCSDGEWIPVGRESDPIIAVIRTIDQLQTPLPLVGNWNDVTLTDVVKDATGSMTASNSIILPYAGIWNIGYIVQPQLPQATVGNMIAQMRFSSSTVNTDLARSQVNFETTNPPVVHYNLSASIIVPTTASNATLKLQVMPSHAGMGVDYRHMWAFLITRL